MQPNYKAYFLKKKSVKFALKLSFVEPGTGWSWSRVSSGKLLVQGRVLEVFFDAKANFFLKRSF